jgi:hypothetical protein
LDDDLPVWMPIPAISAEIQIALCKARMSVTEL